MYTYLGFQSSAVQIPNTGTGNNPMCHRCVAGERVFVRSGPVPCSCSVMLLGHQGNRVLVACCFLLTRVLLYYLACQTTQAELTEQATTAQTSRNPPWYMACATAQTQATAAPEETKAALLPHPRRTGSSTIGESLK